MSTLQNECQSLVTGVADALGAAVVDLETGLLLAAHHNIPYFTQSYLDAVAAAAVDMFRGRTVATVEDMLTNQRGTSAARSIKEVQMATDRTFHFMIILPERPNYLVVLITSRKASLGMGWTRLRQAVPGISALCP